MTLMKKAISTASNYSLGEMWVTEFTMNTDTSCVTNHSTAADFVTEATT
jgi:hypothetical protein